MDLTARSGVNLTSPVRGRVSTLGAVTDMDLTVRSGVNLTSPVRGRVSYTGRCNRHGPHAALRCEPNITSERTCVTHWVL
ncbi:hypothetical protein RRG08_040921 [Elysia crispata]|uniref:Uncharacterized protein n=1 Tax=Elysia crispata TaxID=231223 RepID=A0AAE0ZFH3_9GAST|nr:hypothetical protein RRG08_040921 [Elysia crispata]